MTIQYCKKEFPCDEQYRNNEKFVCASGDKKKWVQQYLIIYHIVKGFANLLLMRWREQKYL